MNENKNEERNEEGKNEDLEFFKNEAYKMNIAQFKLYFFVVIGAIVLFVLYQYFNHLDNNKYVKYLTFIVFLYSFIISDLIYKFLKCKIETKFNYFNKYKEMCLNDIEGKIDENVEFKNSDIVLFNENFIIDYDSFNKNNYKGFIDYDILNKNNCNKVIKFSGDMSHNDIDNLKGIKYKAYNKIYLKSDIKDGRNMKGFIISFTLSKKFRFDNRETQEKINEKFLKYLVLNNIVNNSNNDNTNSDNINNNNINEDINNSINNDITESNDDNNDNNIVHFINIEKYKDKFFIRIKENNEIIIFIDSYIYGEDFEKFFDTYAEIGEKAINIKKTNEMINMLFNFIFLLISEDSFIFE